MGGNFECKCPHCGAVAFEPSDLRNHLVMVHTIQPADADLLTCQIVAGVTPNKEKAIEKLNHNETWAWEKHYHKMKVQPFDVMENRLENPAGIPAKPLANIAYALKYLLRAGFKKGQPWQKEVLKALSHLHRALTGHWLDSDSYLCLKTGQPLATPSKLTKTKR